MNEPGKPAETLEHKVTLYDPDSASKRSFDDRLLDAVPPSEQEDANQSTE